MVMAQMLFLVTLSLIYANKVHLKDFALVIGTYAIFLFSSLDNRTSSVSPVMTLKGLNARLPISFIQISCLILLRIGALRLASTKALLILNILSDFVPFGSPREKRLPSICFITPGRIISVAG